MEMHGTFRAVAENVQKAKDTLDEFNRLPFAITNIVVIFHCVHGTRSNAELVLLPDEDEQNEQIKQIKQTKEMPKPLKYAVSLSNYGYENVIHLTEETRHLRLADAIEDVGVDKVLSKLAFLKQMHENTQGCPGEIFKNDFDWVISLEGSTTPRL